MATKSCIAKKLPNGYYLSIYCHWDGNLDYNGAMLKTFYNTEEKVDKLLALGDISSLKEKIDPDPDKVHTFSEPQEDVVIAYGRDRKEENIEAQQRTLGQLHSGVEYVYMFIDGKWYYSKEAQYRNRKPLEVFSPREVPDFILVEEEGYSKFILETK